MSCGDDGVNCYTQILEIIVAALGLPLQQLPILQCELELD